MAALPRPPPLGPHPPRPVPCCSCLRLRSVFSPTKNLLVDTIRIVIDDMKCE